jgi:uncharacterized membrane protein
LRKVLAVVAALVASLLYAVASVLQQREAEQEPVEVALKIGLLARLARRPWWMTGIVADVGGFLLQFVALARGALVLVQPLLVSGLLFAIPFRAHLSGRRLDRKDWLGVAATTAGLATFLTVSAPANGHADVRPAVWAVLLVAGAIVTAALLFVAHGSTPRVRSLAYGTAAGVIYGECAALTKTTAHLLGLGVGHLVGSWQPYVLIAAGAAGMVLAQSAFQAGPLDASLPTMSAVDPVVSVLIGAVAFGETIRGGVLPATVETLSLGLMVVGIFLLAHSVAVRKANADHVAASIEDVSGP